MTSDRTDAELADPTDPTEADKADSDQPQAKSGPLTGRIAHVTGRKAKDGEPGLLALDELTLHNDDGSVLVFGSPTDVDVGRFAHLAEIPAGVFSSAVDGEREPVCPICLKEPATHKEHVPQEALGGRRMTRTCQRCNNDLGSRVEPELQKWFDHALTKVGMDHDGEVPGKRHLPTIYYRKAMEGNEFVLFSAGGFTDEVSQMLQSGEVRLHYRQPDPRRCGLALLKHAYLAACLCLRSIPDTNDVRAIRADLIAARDTPTEIQPPASEAANRLEVYRSEVGKQGPPLALVARLHPEDETVEPQVFISLAGVLFVSWPFTDSPAGSWQQQVDEV